MNAAGTRRALSTLLGAVVGASLCVDLALPSAQTCSEVDSLLRRTLGFSAADMRVLDTGSAVIRTLETPVREELAHVAAVYVAAPPEQFLERFRDIVRFEEGPGIPQIGRFGHPPRPDDLASLTLPTADVAALRECRPGDCDVKLSAAAMTRFRNDVDWSSVGAPEEANAITRDMLFELVRAYQESGNAALGSYDDSGEPLSVADQFKALNASDSPLLASVPALISYLDDYPQSRPAGVEDFFYWTVVDFGLKPTIRLNHVMIYPLESSSPSLVSHVIAIKQLYASHYFFTTLELRFLIEDDRHENDGLALVSITRSRNDGMTGFKGLFLRPIISRRSRASVRTYLEHIKRQVERPAPVVF